MNIDDLFKGITDSIFERADFPKEHEDYARLYRLVYEDMSRLYATTSVTHGLSLSRADVIKEQEDVFIEELKGIKEGRWPEEESA